MAKRDQKKPQHSVNRNPNRRNGKAWKKNPKRNPAIDYTKRDFLKERIVARTNKQEQKRNEFGHVVKVIGTGDDVHTVVLCDHPKGYIHKDLSKTY